MRQSFGGQVIPGWTTGNPVADIGLWGDESLWYLLAAANGLSGGEALPRGLSLTVPANVVNARQTSETFRVYDPNDALGDVHPNQPRANDPQIAQPAPKKNKGCGGAGQILLAVVAIAVAAVVAQWAIPHLAKTAIGQAIGGALGAAGSTIGTGVAAGAAGSLVSQGVGVAVGLQDRIDWRGVALSAIAGGVGAGIGPSPSGSFVAEGVRGAAANALTQGIAIATGLQSKFDWTGVAVGAVVRGTRGAISNVATGDSWSAELVNHATRGVVAGAAGAGVRSLIDGTSFERSFRAALPDIIGSTIGNAIAGQIGSRPSNQSSSSSSGKSSSGSLVGKVLGGVGDVLGFDGQFGYQGLDGQQISLSNFGNALQGGVRPVSERNYGVGVRALQGGDDGSAVTVSEVVVTAPRDRFARNSFIDDLIAQRVSFALTYNVNDSLAFRHPQVAAVRDAANDVLNFTGSTLLGVQAGFGRAGVDTTLGLFNAVTHPVQTWNALGAAAQSANSYLRNTTTGQGFRDLYGLAANGVSGYVGSVRQEYQTGGLNAAAYRAAQPIGGAAFTGVSSLVGIGELRGASAIAGSINSLTGRGVAIELNAIGGGERYLGMLGRNTTPLTASNIAEARAYASTLGLPEENLQFFSGVGSHQRSAYSDLLDAVFVGPDLLPGTGPGLAANSRVSARGLLAHEIIGHRETTLAGRAFEAGSLYDEVQASWRAARLAPELTAAERTTLLRDAVERIHATGQRVSDIDKSQFWFGR